MSFAQFKLDARLMKGISGVGYITPTPIQSAAMPAVLAGHDLIATAQTGTGKTAVFVLPILNKLVKGTRGRTRALIIVPTRELAEQIHEAIQALGAGTQIRSASIYGGVSAAPQIQALQKGVDIVVACPGRLLDHIEHGYVRFSALEVLVLDEADRMLDMGFLPDVRRILKHIPNERQTLLFGATLPPEIEQLASRELKSPRRIAIGTSCPAHTVRHALFPVAQHLKMRLLFAMLQQIEANSVLIFTRTKHRARRVADQIKRSGSKVTSLHSDRTQNQRQSALNGFKDGMYQIMVATDIAARGLDVESISHVINYDMPDTADAYIHRIGRTGRAERQGEAFTLMTPDDEERVRTVEKTMGKRLSRQMLADFDYSAPAPEKSDLSGRPASSPHRRSPAAGSKSPAHRQSTGGSGRRQGRPHSRQA